MIKAIHKQAHSSYYFLIAALLVIYLSSCLGFQNYDGIYLIPRDYRGGVIVLFNQPDGIDPYVENGVNVYEIPSSGVMKVKTPPGNGSARSDYFYIGEDKVRIKIESIRVTGDYAPDGMPQNKYGNITDSDFESTVYIMGASGVGSFNTAKGITKLRSFIVGTPQQGDRLHEQMRKKISDVHREFIERDLN